MISAEPFVPVPRVILLDLDDTICDYSSARERRLYIALASATGLPEDAPELAALVEASIAMQPHGADHFGQLLHQHGYDGNGRVDAAMRWYRANRFHGLDLFPGAREALVQLRHGSDAGAGRPLGIITNGPAEVQREKVDLLNIRHLVDFVIISGEFGASKPDPSIYDEALRRARATRDEAIFVGDSVDHDMAGAYASGLRSVWINRSGRTWTQRWHAPDRQIRDIGELPRLVGSGG